MTTFLFWNTNRKDLFENIKQMINAHNVDIILLAEAPETAPAQFQVDGKTFSRFKDKISPIPDQFQPIFVYTHLQTKSWRIRSCDSNWLIFEIGDLSKEIIVASAHLPSKLKHKEADQELSARFFIKAIEDCEENRQHNRTVIVGDLNMNPFERSVSSGDQLHGVMTTKLGKRKSDRKISKLRKNIFYNPMWSLFGDRTPGPPGTYYRSSSGVVSYFWSMFDQVLVRKELVEFLGEVKILDSDGSKSLLTKAGIPDKNSLSDHLPLLFVLNEE